MCGRDSLEKNSHPACHDRLVVLNRSSECKQSKTRSIDSSDRAANPKAEAREEGSREEGQRGYESNKYDRSGKKQAKQDLNVIMARIEESSEKLTDLQKRIDSSEKELEETEKQLEKAIQRFEKRNSLLQSRLRLMYMNGTVSYLDVLLNATNFMDFLDRLESIKMIVNKDMEILNAAKKDKELVVQKEAETRLLLEKLKSDYNELAAIRQNLLKQEKTKEVLIASLETEKEQLEEYTKEQEEFLLAAARKEAELNRQKNKVSSSKKIIGYKQKSTAFLYPLPQKYRLTSDFGRRVDPVTGKKGAFHKGLDFGAPGGTNILAAKQGTVLVAQFYGGYGKTVILDHGNGVWTLYAHMREITVKKGETVEQGEVIGKVGSTGKSTGNHLHFEVRINEEAVDPKSYISI